MQSHPAASRKLCAEGLDDGLAHDNERAGSSVYILAVRILAQLEVDTVGARQSDERLAAVWRRWIADRQLAEHNH